MKVLFIGGTGNISGEISKLVIEKGWELYLLNRGNRLDKIPEGAKAIIADINNEEDVSALIKDMDFDVVADFIAFKPEQIERDIRLFSKKTRQFIFISTASVYQKPSTYHIITESTPLYNPYWQYSRDKIKCEELLMEDFRRNKFPVTIVRPSHTYGIEKIPLAVKSGKGAWSVINRIINGKPVIIHGDGTSFWTLTHNTDFAKAFIGLMGNRSAIGEAVHITSDEAITWNEVYNCIGDILNAEVKKVHVASDLLVALKPELEGDLLGDKANSLIFDNSKIKRLVPDFVATTRFYEGVKLSIEYLLANPELQVEDEEFDNFCDKVIELQEKIISSYKN
ncbi:SDR family oxidoreductase [Clostridium sp. 'White wine YQ']|uniref:SDR family oxidoreductase n=1 Tax=Clostridium sp. 'White wine YQ' TaxID=3027474 RepID=UPI002366F729|nr:SDR family oxidoreductase [Clostridium sp. 'White wine YQ']MDD7796162.1 SDR family oxidoreductase [Clostridium sp. 'White wine YQ']